MREKVTIEVSGPSRKAIMALAQTRADEYFDYKRKQYKKNEETGKHESVPNPEPAPYTIESIEARTEFTTVNEYGSASAVYTATVVVSTIGVDVQ